MLLLFLLFTTIKTATSVCTIPLSPDVLRTRESDGPLIYTYRGDDTPALHYPSVDTNCIFRSEDERLHLTCPGPDSTLHFYQKVGNKVQAVNATSSSVYLFHDPTNSRRVRVHGGPRSFDVASGNYIKCLGNLSDTSEMLMDTRSTSREGLTVAYRLNEVDLLKVYHQEYYGDEWVVTHTRIRATPKRPAFNIKDAYEKGLYYRNTRLNFTEIYSKERQRLSFQKRFNNLLMTDTYFADNSSLVAGQLIFEEDMYYFAEKMSTHYYENTAPIWRSVYEGNWQSVGHIIRTLADDTASDFDVYVTVQPSVLAIREPENWLLGRTENSPDVLPVPRMLVKAAIKADNPAEGIVFHTFNDPHLNTMAATQQLGNSCSEIDTDCRELHPEFEDMIRGYNQIFCKLFWNIQYLILQLKRRMPDEKIELKE